MASVAGLAMLFATIDDNCETHGSSIPFEGKQTVFLNGDIIK